MIGLSIQKFVNELIKSITNKLLIGLSILIFYSTTLIASNKTEILINPTIKIACVGNSITYGMGVFNREQNAYPKQLQNMLGSDYKVQNFGVSGVTLLKNGGQPYWETQAYKDALKFKPDIVYIKLGTNDSKKVNSLFYNEFKSDYKELIQSFKDVNSKARIILLLPIPAFTDTPNDIWNKTITNKIIPLTKEVAFETNTELIDLYQLFINHPELVPDKIHPSSLGASTIARRVYEDVVLNSDTNFNLFNNLPTKKTTNFNFHGFEQTDFKLNRIECKIVAPKRVNKNHNWVIRARFWGHEPQTDIALLERGFHIVYYDVSNLYGGPKAIERWNFLYDKLTNAGLSKKVVLEGMSRGGLIVYKWAVANPEKVACIYADAPVLSGKSWPGGFGKSEGYPQGWEKFKQVYGIKSDLEVENFIADPINQIKEISATNIPMLHVCGDSDKVVPVEENTQLFETELKKLNANIEVIYKKGIGHHPHSLENPKPIVDFILRNTETKINFANMAIPGSEYRSAAGWKKGYGWWGQNNDIDSLSHELKTCDLLLLGNSITQGFGGSRTKTTYAPGKKATDKYFKNLYWLNAGISGDRTEHTAYRLKYGTSDTLNPKFISLAIGVNNFPFNNAEEIAEGILLNIKTIQEKFPQSKILLNGPLPTGINHNSERRKKYDRIHEIISTYGNLNNVYYYNLTPLFVDENNDLDLKLYGTDGIHLHSAGYEVWSQFLREEIEKLKNL
ncbi:GDSL-type esterase/lipase family protein [Urechidicola vernalis]|uniref:GDSL-type esterase/lipase family protein n=1 Tax=Urechidicola vernalis TaxID=3075600 RepID=A0ABU2Y5I8_9FLAO|nr:GDSL-type esterase/lipase family protein [Urechidicola sp. P050]MDT0553061.1 GDSL-type esterase/lipase family protein [Urechidicola sp. P050]